MRSVDDVIELAVVGAGVCGLALTRALHRAGREVQLFEARTRLGGRVESATCGGAATRVDLGPTWYWPRTQPLMTELVQALALRDYPQHDPGEVLLVTASDEPARSLQAGRLHAHAQRLSGGMATLVQALAADIPAARLHTQHTLVQVRRVTGERPLIELHLDRAGERMTVKARKLVLALPPRLIAERVQFEPALSDELREALRAVPTWMATQAKAVHVFERASWRDAGHSGSALMEHKQAVLREVFDACEAEHALAALGGFLALSPRERRSFQAGLPLLLRSQLTQLFGEVLWDVEQHYRDWATQPLTCSELDLHDYAAEARHPEPAPALQRAHWNSCLYFAGTETAERDSGYLEGALVAAERVARALDVLPQTEDSDAPEAFRQWLQQRMPETLQDYQRRIVATLAEQDHDRATQRALVGAIEAFFRAALAQLQALRTTAELGAQQHAAVRDFLADLIAQVLTFNRRSCALSNFDDEHRPAHTYVQDILRDVDAAYRSFARASQQLVAATQ